LGSGGGGLTDGTGAGAVASGLAGMGGGVVEGVADWDVIALLSDGTV